MNRRSFVRLLALAFAFGVVAAVLKGQSGDGVSLMSRVRSDVGNLSAPWLLVAWYAGSRSTRVPLAAALGLAATLAALTGFYVVSAVVEPMGNDVATSSMRWIAANRVWFEAALVSAPVFGALGGWWARRGAPSAAVVVGLLLLGEPIVLLATGAIFPNGVLSPATGLPLVVRVVPGFGLSDVPPSAMAVHGLEFLGGLVLVVVGTVGRRRRRHAAPTVTA